MPCPPEHDIAVGDVTVVDPEAPQLMMDCTLHVSAAPKCQDFEFLVLLVLRYVRVASLFYIERVGPDQF
jgi:hypothetical protein